MERLDRGVGQRIRKFLQERVAPMQDPRSIGQRCTVRASVNFGNTE